MHLITSSVIIRLNVIYAMITFPIHHFCETLYVPIDGIPCNILMKGNVEYTRICLVELSTDTKFIEPINLDLIQQSRLNH